MKSLNELPHGYISKLHISMQNDKRTMLTINIIGIVITVLMIIIMNAFVPLVQLIDGMRISDLLIMTSVLIFSYIAYIVLHELTHAAVMKAVGGGKVRFGFTGMYAFAGSTEDFFDKAAYRLIALAPLFVWGIVFAVLQAALPLSWSWVIWMLQVGNVGGSAGDVYVTLKLMRMPSTILINDTGLEVTVYDEQA